MCATKEEMLMKGVKLLNEIIDTAKDLTPDIVGPAERYEIRGDLFNEICNYLDNNGLRMNWRE